MNNNDFSKLFNKLCNNSSYNNTEIANKLNVDKATISRWRKGERTPKLSKLKDIADLFGVDVQIFNIQSNLTPITSNLIQIPVYGKISCGTGGFNEDYIDGYFSIPENMINKRKEYFGMYADGDSMINENINPGDLIIFEKSQFLNNNEVGCFCIDENFATCKIFQKTSDMIYLYPANTNYQPIPITVDNTMFHIIGKLAFVVNNRLRGKF
ncbi:hypothetical protein B7939_00845 [Eggerthia catenaformis]|nr:hypothetical protein B7939_00845 [Eggerthia catenaformis]